MNTRRTLDRRVEENNMNDEIPPKVEQVHKIFQGDQGVIDDQVPIVEGGGSLGND